MSVNVTAPQEREVTIVVSESTAALLRDLMSYVENATDEFNNLLADLEAKELKASRSLVATQRGTYRAFDAATEW